MSKKIIWRNDYNKIYFMRAYREKS